ncbi:MAG: MMPL family transporter [Rhodospirillum sp.]|nr:MMPL family transporter [Rhodospirillum sp.]MCF8489962.1 MMPL family transporter [Rhodospirillum sp.]MCF8501033.1 MMPL family transporter [Rhodospirillum sp.]
MSQTPPNTSPPESAPGSASESASLSTSARGPAPNQDPAPDPADPPPGSLEGIVTRLATALVGGARRRPGIVLVLGLLLMALSGWAMATRLGISTATDAMLSPDLPFQKNHARFLEAFPELGGDLIVVIDGQTPALAARASDRLVAGLRAREDLFESAVDIAGLPFFRREGLLYLPREELERLATTLTRAQPFIAGLWADPSLRGLAEVMDMALGHGGAALAQAGEGGGAFTLAPILDAMAEVTAATARGESARMAWSSVLGASQTTGTPTRRFILVKPILDQASLAPAAAAITALRTLAEEEDLRPAEGVTMRVTGSAALAQEELSSVRTGMDLAGTVTLVLVSVLLAVGLGSGRLILGTFCTLVAGLLITAGFATLAVGTLNLISVAFAVLFIGLSVDFGIHFGLRYREGRDNGLENASALDQAARGVGAPLFLAALCAAISFLAFLPTDYLGLAQLGLISGVGMFIAFLANLTLLPAMLTVLPARARTTFRRQGRSEASIAQFPRRHPRGVLIVTGVLALAALIPASVTRFDFDPLNLRDPHGEAMSTLLDVMGDPGIDPYSIDVLAPDLEQATALTTALEALPEVKGVASLPALVPGNQEEKLLVVEDLAFVLGPSLSLTPLPPPSSAALSQARDRLVRTLAKAAGQGGTPQPPGSLADAAGRFAAALAAMPSDSALLDALDDRLMDGLTYQLALFRDGLEAQGVTEADIPPALRHRYLSDTGAARLEVFPRADLRNQAALETFVAAVRTVAPQATGAPVLILEAGKAVMGAFLKAGLIGLALIVVLLYGVMRSTRVVLLVLSPVALTGLFTLAGSVLIGQSFNFANVIVLPLLVGLGVAGGIHVVGRERQEHDAVNALDSSTPRAVVFSALTTIGSFGSIALSSHPGTASMGVLLTLSIFLGLVCTLGVLPALLAYWPTRVSALEPDRKDGARGTR